QKAVDSCFWPLYEVENGVTRITYRPKKKLPVSEWLKGQGRFAHLFQPENSHMIETIQKEVDNRWENLLLDEEISQRKKVS
ncbi:MAG: pyruvate ferredoxin oxidoreductase, partial [bacterium]|nr:pyruvate ferredoxin oxidoreductase [bacterium]